MSVIEVSVRRPVGLTVVVSLLMLFGLLALMRLPIQLTPNVDQPQIKVTTLWFGASAVEIEKEIVEEQERVLKDVEGLRDMLSSSIEGRGEVDLYFQVGVDKDAALAEVRDKLRQINYNSDEIDEPIAESISSASEDAIAWLIIRPVGGEHSAIDKALASGRAAPGFRGDVTEIEEFLADEAVPLMERVPGVSRVDVFGGRAREARITLDLERLASRGIPVRHLVAVLQAENRDATAGTYDIGKRQISVRATGQFQTVEQLEQTVIGYEPAGAPVTLGDVADVQLDYKKQAGFVRSRGEDVLAMRVQKQIGSNALRVMEGLKEAISEVNAHVLGPRNWGLELFQLYDETVYIRSSIDTAQRNLLIGAGLAAAVLLLTLRSVGATVVICAAIPVSVVGTFLGMYVTGRNLNVISIAGLAFAIGMGIDNAIVVLENIFRHREMGKSRFVAAIDGAREVLGAIVAATLTNIAVFVPIILIEEEAGQLFRDYSIAISISFILYLLVSPTVIPMLASLLLRRPPKVAAHASGQTRLGGLTSWVAALGGGIAGWFYAAVFWLTGGFFRRAILVTVIMVASVWASFALIPPRDYLPSGNQNFVFGLMFPPPGYSLGEFRQIAGQVEGQLRPWWEAKEGSPELAQLQERHRQMMQGMVLPMMRQQVEEQRKMLPPEKADAALAPLLKRIQQMERMPPPSAIDNYFFVGFIGRIFMGATSKDPANVASTGGQLTGINNSFPGIAGFAFQVPIFRLGNRGGGSGASIELTVQGSDYEQVTRAAGALQGALTRAFYDFARSEPINYALGRPELRIVPDRVRAAAAGVSVAEIRDFSRVAGDGLIIGEFRDQGKNIDLTVVAARDGELDSGRMSSLPLVSRQGRIVPLSAVADLVHTDSPQQINRTERLPSVTLQVQLPQGMTVDEAQRITNEQVLEPLRASGAIPPGVTIRPSGSADKLSQFMKAFIPGFLLAALITYLLLAALYESFVYPFVIILSVPLALVGGFVALAILHATTGATMDVLTMLGFVILVGTIINNPILIVHQALNYMRAGLGPREAIATSTKTRVRPIFMSVLTSVAGMAPMVIIGGPGSELYRGLGAVVIGGLVLSTAFTLFLTPMLMSLALDGQTVVLRLFGMKPMEVLVSGPASEAAQPDKPTETGSTVR